MLLPKTPRHAEQDSIEVLCLVACIQEDAFVMHKAWTKIGSEGAHKACVSSLRGTEAASAQSSYRSLPLKAAVRSASAVS